MLGPQLKALMAAVTKTRTIAAAGAALFSSLLLTAQAAGQASPSGIPAPAQRSAPPAHVQAPPPPNLGEQVIPPPPDLSDIPPAPLAALPPERTVAPASGSVPASLRGKDSVALAFPGGSDTPPAEAAPLLADVVARLKAQPAERLELHAQAPSRADRVGEGRRLALLRARAVRTQLVAKGIEPTRLIVFAQTVPTGTPDSDRVDLVFRP